MELNIEEIDRLCYQVDNCNHNDNVSNFNKFFQDWSNNTSTEQMDLRHLQRSIKVRKENLQERLSLHPARRRVSQSYEQEHEIKDMKYVISQLNQQIQRKKQIVNNLKRNKSQIEESIRKIVDEEQIEEIQFDGEIDHKEKNLKLYHYLAPIHWVDDGSSKIRGVLVHSENESHKFEFEKGDDRLIANCLWKKLSELKSR